MGNNEIAATLNGIEQHQAAEVALLKAKTRLMDIAAWTVLWAPAVAVLITWMITK